MKAPITQTKSWQNLQNDLKKKSFYKETKSFQYLAILETTPVGNYLYLPYGPVYKSAIGRKEAIESLTSLAKEQNAFFIRIEPRDPDFAKNLPKKAKKSHDLNPKETWILDLTGNELKSRLPSRLLRYAKNAEKKGLKITTSKDPADIDHLLSLQKALANQKGISTFSAHYLKTELAQPFATLYLVHYNPPEEESKEQVVAAGLVFDDQDTRYNLQGAQSEQGRKLHATGILTIKLIQDAAEKKLKTFDFWGIAPENAPKNHPWAGFTNFKKTFAGQELDFAGTYDLILNRPRYTLYSLLRHLNRVLRRK